MLSSLSLLSLEAELTGLTRFFFFALSFFFFLLLLL
jgi:hypothetical protein